MGLFLLPVLFLVGCNATTPKKGYNSGGVTLYEERMKGVTCKSADNLRRNGYWVMERNSPKGYVRAFSIGFPSVSTNMICSFPSESINPYKVDNVIIDNHHVISSVTSFWSGCK
jgi:hypothetical protein